MKQLIFRDLFIYQRRNYIVLAIFSLIWASLHKEEASMLIATCIFFSLFEMVMTMNTTFSYDETDKSNRFLRALPATAFEVVFARYLSLLCAGLIGAAIGMVPGVVMGLISRNGMLSIPAESVTMMLVFVSVMLLFCAVGLPVTYRFTYMKTRYIWMVVYICFAMVGAKATTNGALMRKAVSALSFLFGTALGISMVTLISLALFAASMWLSVRIFKAKEE